MNKQRLILYLFFLFTTVTIIQYYNIADAQIKGGGGGSSMSIEITAPTKNSDESIIDTTIYIIDTSEFNVNTIEINASTTLNASNLNCIYQPETFVCGVAGCDIIPANARCTLSINSSGDLYISTIDDIFQTTIKSELGYVIEENQSQSLGSSNQSHKSGYSVRFTCKDKKAINYDRFGRHDESRCKYPKKVSISEAMILQLITLLENLKEQLLSQ